MSFRPGNETGWVTPRALYEGEHAPTWEPAIGWVWHGTVGRNTLRYWGTGQSAVPDNWSLAAYLLPHNTTQYADGQFHGTEYTVFKMAPDNRRCNHAGVCNPPLHNGNSYGVEYESLQNGTHDIDVSQYIKGALIHAYNAAVFGIPDHLAQMHGMIAKPWGRRSDPWAGLWDVSFHWALVREIRRDRRIWHFWNVPQPQGGANL